MRCDLPKNAAIRDTPKLQSVMKQIVKVVVKV